MNDFEKTLKKMQEIHKKKSHDYAADGDPYSNFRMCEEMNICSVETGFLVRMTDKMSRIVQLLKKDRQVEDETIEDTLIDLAVYSIRLKNYLESAKK